MFEKSKEHLAETGFSWYEHWCHVWRMVGNMLRALFYSIPHAFIPEIYPGTARDIIFRDMLEDQLESRPDLLTKGK